MKGGKKLDTRRAHMYTNALERARRKRTQQKNECCPKKTLLKNRAFKRKPYPQCAVKPV